MATWPDENLVFIDFETATVPGHPPEPIESQLPVTGEKIAKRHLKS